MDNKHGPLYDPLEAWFLWQGRPVQKRAQLACPPNKSAKISWETCVFIEIFLLQTYSKLFRGIIELTSEEVTARRRAERKQFKLDRAAAIAAVAEEAEQLFEKEGKVVVPALSGPAIPSAATWKPAPKPVEAEVPSTPAELEEPESWEEEPLENVEHMQLTLQEAFFLAWNLDCLTVLHPDTVCAAFHPQSVPSDVVHSCNQ